MKRLILIKKKQQGAALIAVLIILVVITLLGIAALRMSLSSLNLATNSQVSQLLFQSADLGTSRVVGLLVSDPAQILDSSGMLGDTSGKEMNLCLYPNTGATYGQSFQAGVCNLSASSGYVSERQLVATVVTAQRTDAQKFDTNSDSSNLTQEGSGDAPLKEEILKLHSTSIIPSFGSASTADITNCLAKPSDDEDQDALNQYTKTDCLTDKGAVFTTHVSEYKIIR